MADPVSVLLKNFMSVPPISYNSILHPLPAGIDIAQLPAQFTYPFNYTPHAASVAVAEELQQYLAQKSEWAEELSLNRTGGHIGKMFGVLIVETPTGEKGYLTAFSGAIGGKNDWQGFVPTLYDRFDPEGFFKIGEEEINKINRKVEAFEQSEEYQQAKVRAVRTREESELKIEAIKQEVKARKAQRALERTAAAERLSPEDFEALLNRFSFASQHDRRWMKGAIKEEKRKVAIAQEQLQQLSSAIKNLKEERRERSNKIQQQIFDCYNFLNIRGERKSVREIFGEELPPAGAGDCAGPRLLQYAFARQLKPICMAEFWYGTSPKTVIRKHLRYYPACRGKCKPIFEHMLQGLDIEPNPMHGRMINPEKIKLIYEDDDIVVVNKPSGFLSVPGKEISDSIQERVKQQCPDATGPMIVHRLDMDTSGVMVVAKNDAAYKHLQMQFIKRTVNKRYTAILEGYVKKTDGYIDLPLRVDLDNRPNQMVCFEHGKHARTHFEVIWRKNGQTKVHFHPITGRTHQLRMHASHADGLNCPIVGDDLYGQRAHRLHLHAEMLEIVHPVRKEPMTFHIPADFSKKE
ncbi:RluA family pseudouridine synthase [Persicobacter psychrovividus]